MSASAPRRANERRNADLFYADLIGRPVPARRALHPSEDSEGEGVLSDVMRDSRTSCKSAEARRIPRRARSAHLTGSAFMKTDCRQRRAGELAAA